VQVEVFCHTGASEHSQSPNKNTAYNYIQQLYLPSLFTSSYNNTLLQRQTASLDNVTCA